MKKALFALSLAAVLFSCTEQPKEPKIGLCPKQFGTAQFDGQEVKFYTLKNANGFTAQFINLGAKLVSLYAPDRNGKFEDVVLGYPTAEEYAKCEWGKHGEPVFGATIGRYGNRIAQGKFTLDDVEYNVNIDENDITSLHGGVKGYHSLIWDVRSVSATTIEFAHRDSAGFMGFPGNVDVVVTYALTDTNSVVITYKATTDAPTVINLTHHSFFNLSGEGAPTINDHTLLIPANQITPVDKDLIPTGELLDVAGTPFDFNTQHAIGDSLESQHEQIIFGHGYDHNWALSSPIDSITGLRLAARLASPVSGRVLTVLTTEPGVQFYGGNFLDNTQVGKSGKTYPYRSALCLETQHFPDSPNHDNFPSTVLRPGETYSQVCVYALSVE